jgi:serine/threonine protein kinase
MVGLAKSRGAIPQAWLTAAPGPAALQVYRGQYCHTPVAVKALLQDADDVRNAEEQEKFLKEVSIQKSLRHPMVVQFLVGPPHPQAAPKP